MYRVNAANMRRTAKDLAEVHGTGFLALEEDEEPPLITVEQRRKDYWCGEYFVKATDLPTWEAVILKKNDTGLMGPIDTSTECVIL